jgi:hypothetical protein
MGLLLSIEQEKLEDLIPYLGEQVEFDYSHEAYTMFSRIKDSRDLQLGQKSEYYRFLFQLDSEMKKDKSWLSFKEALKSSYKVEAENNEVNEDGSYLRSIHIYNEASYNRISLRCQGEDNCKITSLLIAASKI